jgi:hypothetical protein
MQSGKEVSDIVQHKVRRAVGMHALGKIRRMVDQWHQEEETDKKLWRATLIAFTLVLLGLLLAVGYFPHDTAVIGGSDMGQHTTQK